MSTQAQERASAPLKASAESDVRLVGIRKTFGEVVAVDTSIWRSGAATQIKHGMAKLD